MGLTQYPPQDDSAARMAASINAATAKTTPVDADLVPITDSADSFALKKATWANIKATLKAYFDTLYAALSGSASQVFSVGAATADAHAVGAKQLQTQALTAFTTSGTDTAFTLTTTNAPALTTGERWYVTFNAASGATPTLDRDSKGAKSLKYRDSAGTKQSITATQVPSGWSSDVVYDGTDYVVLEVVRTHAPDYVSPDQTITSAAQLTLTHGFSAEPSYVEIEAVCQSADANWAANDVITVAAFAVNTGGSGLALNKDATNIYIRFSNLANALQYNNKSTGAASNLDNTKWKLRVKAWR